MIDLGGTVSSRATQDERSVFFHQSQQEKITILDSGDFQIPQNAFANHKVLLAGAWVESEYELSDAAVYSGRSAGRLISSLID